jgi:hypothetical protein
MVDKLLIEIDLHDSYSALPALIFLANALAQSSTIVITDDDEWEESEGDGYSIKWRFTELRHPDEESEEGLSGSRLTRLPSADFSRAA